MRDALFHCSGVREIPVKLHRYSGGQGAQKLINQTTARSCSKISGIYAYKQRYEIIITIPRKSVIWSTIVVV